MLGEFVKRVRVGALAGGGEIHPRPAARIHPHRARRRREGREAAHGPLLQRRRPFLRPEIEQIGRQGVIGRPCGLAFGHRGLAGLEIIEDRGETVAHQRIHPVIRRYGRIGHPGEQRLHPLMEERGPMLQARKAPAGADGFIEWIIPPAAAEALAILGAEAFGGGRIQRRLLHRFEGEACALIQAALAHGIEAANGFQRIAEKIQPHRLIQPRREEIDDPAAHGELARLAHRLGSLIAEPGELIGQPVKPDLVPHSQIEGLGFDHGARRGALGDRGDSGEQQQPARLGPGQLTQGIQPPRHDVPGG